MAENPTRMQYLENMQESLKSGIIKKAKIYTCNDYAVLIKNDSADYLREEFDADHIMNALEYFGGCPERCRLVLELENGLEIGIMPSLKKEIRALDEIDREEILKRLDELSTGKTPHPWEIKIDMWPL